MNNHSVPIQSLDEFQRQVRDLTPIRVENTFVELTEHINRAERIASLHATAVAQVERIKQSIDRVEAEIYLSHRQHIPKRSEKEIEALQDIDESVVYLRGVLAEAMSARVYMDDVARAFDTRGTMLVNLRKLIEAESR
jgi:hypothetical protein